jgi:hypothetical protein
MQIMEIEYLIIGNADGGIGAAEAICQIDKSRPAAIVSEKRAVGTVGV